MKLHELCELFPKIEGREFNELVASIKANGLENPITTLNGEILDGGNRFRACKKAGVDPRFQEFKGEDAWQFVKDQNVNRRHLSEGQLQMVAAGLATRKQGYQKKGAVAPLPPTIEQAAEMLNTSERGVKRASRIKRESPELATHVTNGSVSITAAEKVSRAPKKKREKAIEEGPDAVNELASREAERARIAREKAKQEADEEEARIKAEKEEAKRAAKEAKAKAAREPAKAKEIAALEARMDGMPTGSFIYKKLSADLAKLRGGDEAPAPAIDRLIEWLKANRAVLLSSSIDDICRKAANRLN